MKGHPIGPRVLIRPHEQAKEVGSIVIPELAQERPASGEILEVGEECGNSFVPGRVVIFRNKSGTDMTYDGERVFLLDTNEVLGWLE